MPNFTCFSSGLLPILKPIMEDAHIRSAPHRARNPPPLARPRCSRSRHLRGHRRRDFAGQRVAVDA